MLVSTLQLNFIEPGNDLHCNYCGSREIVVNSNLLVGNYLIYCLHIKDFKNI